MADRARNEAEPAIDLAGDAVRAMQELVKLEIALARDELRADLDRMKRAGVELAVAACSAIIAVTLLLVAIAAGVVAPTWLVALVIGGGLLVVAAVLAGLGWRALPHHPGEETKRRLETDVERVKESVE